jgi:hypothetical protein
VFAKETGLDLEMGIAVVDRSIDIDELWHAAARKLRVRSDPPQDVNVEGLRCLASALGQAGRYDADASRLLQREIFSRILSDLKLTGDFACFSELNDVPVHRPLLVAGFGRTGSTLLHNLLALDPNARAPLLWEIWNPSPPPRPETRLSDPRIEIAQRRLDAFTSADPSILKIHPMAARAPDECHWMMRHSPQICMLYEVPEYWLWLKQLSDGKLEELYAHYRLQVKHLQLFCRRRHWVSKAMAHAHFVPVLFNVFPDARIVRLHRDPCDAVPSLCSLFAGYRSLFSSRVNRDEIGSTILDMFVDHMKRAIAVPADKADQVIDIHFDDLVANPISTVRHIYRQLDYPYGAAFEREVVRHLDSERAATKPRHIYSLEQFGLSRATVIGRSAEYLQWVGQLFGGRVESAWGR